MATEDSKYSLQALAHRSFNFTYGVFKQLVYGYDGSALQPLSVDTSGRLDLAGGLGIPRYDYVDNSGQTATSDVLVLKSGGAGGSTLATVTISYTDATKSSFNSIAKT